ncbi:hypothetical protein [Desulfamplus magnetovallimortis]|nr:hypothetical protein [Desulfamplus magnetovallimortis]
MPYLVNLGNPDSDSVDKAYKIIGVDFESVVFRIIKLIMEKSNYLLSAT